MKDTPPISVSAAQRSTTSSRRSLECLRTQPSKFILTRTDVRRLCLYCLFVSEMRLRDWRGRRMSFSRTTGTGNTRPTRTANNSRLVYAVASLRQWKEILKWMPNCWGCFYFGGGVDLLPQNAVTMHLLLKL